ncbi:MAG TPA: hypothetical protein VFO38_00955 [Candidatus Saccharimonadales bacterium]|nr:hypothetical protein [Candidatus Saccharimonadales bacterium]
MILLDQSFTLSKEVQQLQVNGYPVSDVAVLIAVLVAIFGLAPTLWSSFTANRATKLSNLPILRIKHKRDAERQSFFDASLILDNIGKGVAYDIKIEGGYMYVKGELFGVSIEDVWGIKFSAGRQELAQHESRTLEVEGYEKGKKAPDGQAHLDLALVSESIIKIPVLYRDVTGQRYITLIGMGKGEVWIIRPSRVYRLRWRLWYWVKYRILSGITLLWWKVLLLFKDRRSSNKKP